MYIFMFCTYERKAKEIKINNLYVSSYTYTCTCIFNKYNEQTLKYTLELKLKQKQIKSVFSFALEITAKCIQWFYVCQ